MLHRPEHHRSRGRLELVVLADTHLRQGLDRLPMAVHQAIETTRAVLHAGDVTSARALGELRSVCEAHAVLGNNDLELRGALAETLLLELAGVRVALIHDGGPKAGRPGRLKRRFPEADLVVFGHSHVPVDEEGIGGQRLFNPGSPTQRRSQPNPTFGRLVLEEGRVVDHRILTLVSAPGSSRGAGRPDH